jgi:hypothetical protein
VNVRNVAHRNRSLAAIAPAMAFAIALAPLPAGAEPNHPTPLSTLTPAPAPTAEVVASARSHFQRGVKLYEEDDFRAALIEFNRAYELAPNWAVLFNVGQAYYQLRDYAGALRTLERYEAEGGAQIPSDRRAQIDRELVELRGRVAHVTLATSVEGADVSLDDAVLGKSPLTAPVLIGAGRHRLTAVKAGYSPAVRIVDIAGGDEITIALDLHEEEAHAAAPATTESPNYAGAAAILGVGLAGIAVGTIFGVAAVGNKSSLTKDCNADKACPASAQSEIDAYSRNGAVSTVGFGVGGVALVLGAYLFFHERSKEHAAVAAAGPRVRGVRGVREEGVKMTPWLGLGSAGVVGSF